MHDALRRAHDTSAGPDEIHYQLLKHLPDPSLIPTHKRFPQGSILSVTLFSVKINSIAQCFKPGVDCSLYVDDFQISTDRPIRV